MTAIRWAIAATLLVSLDATFAADGLQHAAFFGRIRAACEDAECNNIRKLLRAMDTDCTLHEGEREVRCKAAKELLKRVFEVYVPSLPKYMLYLEQCKAGAEGGACERTPGQFRGHVPLLMLDNENTPYLYGSRQIYALVFSEYKSCINGSVTINYRSEPNPLSLVFSVLGSSAKLEPAAAKASDSKPVNFRWYSLTGNQDPKSKGMWLALGGAVIEDNTISWVTVEPVTPRPKSAQNTANLPDECIAAEDSDQIQLRTIGKQPNDKAVGARDLFNTIRPLEGETATLTLKDRELDIRIGQARPKPKADEAKTSEEVKKEQDEEKKKKEEKDKEPKNYQADFLGGDAFFSNSPGGYATVSIALGGTKGTKDTSLGGGGNDWNYNGYALVKAYLVRPTLRPTPASPCRFVPDWLSQSPFMSRNRCPSVGFFGGTNVRSDPFTEIVWGASIGHLFDNVGIVVGRNAIAGGKNGQEGRQRRPFFGIDYSF